MQLNHQQGIFWGTFDLLSNCPRIKHGVFLKHGGCSTDAFASLNLGDNVGDLPINVMRNRQAACEILGLSKLAYGRQCHGKIVHQISNTEAAPRECDALTTNIPEIGLMITHADCQAGIIYDPVNHALANVHSGWRGSVLNIFAETVDFMKKQYQSSPDNLLICISPSLGPTDAQFINYQQELPQHFWEYQIKPTYFDFWEITRMQLMQCGVLENHIEIAGISTYSQSEDYFSYRRKNNTGRHGTIAVLLSS